MRTYHRRWTPMNADKNRPFSSYRRLSAFIGGFIFFCSSAVAQHHNRYLMDFGWTFSLGDPAHAEKSNFNDSSWRKLDLPHDWSLEGPWLKDNPSGPAGPQRALVRRSGTHERCVAPGRSRRLHRA